MSKPITGKTTISVWKQKRKNGDIYVWERQTVYIPETRKTKELSRKLLGKIPAGSTDGEIVPTRPSFSSNGFKTPPIAAAAATDEPDIDPNNIFPSTLV